MRKDTHLGYHPTSHTPISGLSKGKARYPKNRKVRKHNCMICRHIEAEQVNRKVLEGWRYVDIMKQHPWIRCSSVIQEHVTCLGLKEDLEEIRQIKLKKILEDIIRAGLPLLDEGKVYPRDMIEAAKALGELEKKGSVKRIWEMIEFGRSDAQNERQTDNQASQTSLDSRLP